MKTIFLAASLLACSFLYAESVESSSQPNHYSIEFYDAEKDNSRAAPCNYDSNTITAICYQDETNFMKAYFKSVPTRMRAKHFSSKQIAQFKKEQAAFEKRAMGYCNRQDDLYYKYSQGSGSGRLYYGCQYLEYHPRYLKVKKMLGEPHPVKRKS